MSNVFDNGEVFEEEFRVLLPDTTVRWLAFMGKVYRTKDGRPIRMSGVTHDITRRKELVQELRKRDIQMFRQLDEINSINADQALKYKTQEK